MEKILFIDKRIISRRITFSSCFLQSWKITQGYRKAIRMTFQKRKFSQKLCIPNTQIIWIAYLPESLRTRKLRMAIGLALSSPNFLLSLNKAALMRLSLVTSDSVFCFSYLPEGSGLNCPFSFRQGSQSPIEPSSSWVLKPINPGRVWMWPTRNLVHSLVQKRCDRNSGTQPPW